jgi:hypothetical protein
LAFDKPELPFPAPFERASARTTRGVSAQFGRCGGERGMVLDDGKPEGRLTTWVDGLRRRTDFRQSARIPQALLGTKPYRSCSLAAEVRQDSRPSTEDSVLQLKSTKSNLGDGLRWPLSSHRLWNRVVACANECDEIGRAAEKVFLGNFSTAYFRKRLLAALSGSALPTEVIDDVAPDVRGSRGDRRISEVRSDTRIRA